MIIDTHSHLYLPAFDEDRPDMLQRAREAGVAQVLLPAIDSDYHDALVKLWQSDQAFFKPMMGVHPCSVQPNNYKEELRMAGELLDQYPFVAVGEIGIDLHWDKSTLPLQIEAFETQIDWAKERNLPIVIHCREAFKEIFEVLDRLHDERLRGVFHCFTGTAEDAARIKEYGTFLMGLGGVLTFKNSGLDKVVSEFSLRHFVLETDAPYLAPTPHRGRRNESAYVQFVLKRLAEIKKLPETLVAERTSENARAMFQIN